MFALNAPRPYRIKAASVPYAEQNQYFMSNYAENYCCSITTRTVQHKWDYRGFEEMMADNGRGTLFMWPQLRRNS